ncbi:MAG TPA: DinB family protein, partial [Chloroflexia bacterium]|nr:DinB family protein [Chloroflexia bacterium]
ADAARADYAQLDPEVAAVCADVSEAAATHRPAPDAWNAREVLAHLIVVERDIQTWITKMIEGADLSDQFHANDLTRLSALAGTYPTVADLLTELRRSEAATVAMIANLPPEVAARKYLLQRLANWIPETPIHVREHLDELRALLAAAPACLTLLGGLWYFTEA